jgi:uncharacterized membrane protein YfcA
VKCFLLTIGKKSKRFLFFLLFLTIKFCLIKKERERRRARTNVKETVGFLIGGLSLSLSLSDKGKK